MSLFVDENEDTSVPYKPSTSTIAEEDDEDDYSKIKPDPDAIQEDPEPTIEEDVDEDDPIITSIPLYINTLPQRLKQSLHVLQYPGRPKSRPNRAPNCHVSIKPESQYMQLKIPVEINNYFDKDKIEEWGEQIGEQTLSGVLDSTAEVGNYAAKIINEGNERKVILIPVDSSVQLRSSFKYIDDKDAQALQQRKQLEASTDKPTSVQVLQSAAKHSSASGEFSHSLGDSLKSVKRFEEEEWQNLVWKKGNDTITKELKRDLDRGIDDFELETKTSYDEYIERIIYS
ncbi:RNA polymerase III subunit, putative, partial [Candida maltosa Xu316]